MLQLKYLREIDSALGSSKPVPLNGRHQEANRFLQHVLGWRVPGPLDRPCKLLSCNKEAAPGKDFCSAEHDDAYCNQDDIVRVKISCLWCSPSALLGEFGRGCNLPGWRWNNLQLVSEGDYDYLTVINRPHHEEPIFPERTIVFHMEPKMEKDIAQWGLWTDPEKNLKVLKAFTHKVGHNNIQWHLNKNYDQLTNEVIVKTENKFSAINSAKYTDIGHCLRWDFCTYLAKHRTADVPLDLFGTNRFNLPNHKGPLPNLDKTRGIYPYKYHIAVENNSEHNYVTEKLIDGILSESLVFYWGCPNIRNLIDPRAYVQINLGSFQEDANLMARAIREDWWSQRIQYIREAKKKIMNEMAFLPRLEKYLATVHKSP